MDSNGSVAQASKCAVCGHHGRSRALQMMRGAGASNLFGVTTFDFGSQDAKAKSLQHCMWSFTIILRQRVFPDSPVPDPEDTASRHLLAFGIPCLVMLTIGHNGAHSSTLLSVGDAPIGTARWRLTTEKEIAVVRLELVAILPDKRHQGYGAKFLIEIVKVRPFHCIASHAAYCIFIRISKPERKRWAWPCHPL